MYLSLVLLVTACAPPSLLITPVSSGMDMVEKTIADGWFFTPKVAIIDVGGTLINDHQSGFLSQGEHPVSRFKEQLDLAREDDMVKVVVLRINSPGGTVVASELMHDELVHFRRDTGKRVIAMLMDVAASGGYYLACGCDEIVAQPSTVTGSIGVIMQTFDVSGTMEMIGIKADAITSGERKDSGSPFRPMRPEEREAFQAIINDMYGRFVRVVDEGRPNLSEAQVRELADGRVFTAGQAVEAGLVDRISCMSDLLEEIKEDLGRTEIRLVTYRRPGSFVPNYYARMPVEEGFRLGAGLLALEVFGADLLTPRFMYLWLPGSG